MYTTADIYLKDFTINTDQSLFFVNEFQEEKYTVYESNDMRV